MTKNLKESLKDSFVQRAAEAGVPDLLDKIADESNCEDSEKLLEFLSSVGHPALEMDPMF
jgi:acetyl-CoA synthase